MIKRLIAVLLAGMLLLGIVPVLAEEETTEEPAEVTATPEPLPPYPDRNYEELVVGNPTPMDGKFFTGMWGNSTTDIDVRTLVNSYYLTTWAYDTGIFHANPVVVSGAIVVVNDDDGSRRYVFRLADDLFLKLFVTHTCLLICRLP